MHKITMYEGLRDKIDTEIENINTKGITNENLDHLYKLAMSLKAIDKHIWCLEMDEEEKEHEEGYSGNRRRFPMGRSYARRRDAMGRYSGDDWELRKIHDYPYMYEERY